MKNQIIGCLTTTFIHFILLCFGIKWIYESNEVLKISLDLFIIIFNTIFIVINLTRIKKFIK